MRRYYRGRQRTLKEGEKDARQRVFVLVRRIFLDGAIPSPGEGVCLAAFVARVGRRDGLTVSLVK